jgi:hypothetical protein
VKQAWSPETTSLTPYGIRLAPQLLAPDKFAVGRFKVAVSIHTSPQEATGAKQESEPLASR